MAIQILFALLAGVLTIFAPCILPVLPILLGSSVGQTNKQRPLLIVAGFIVSFAAVSLLLSYIIERIGLSPNIIRDAAIILLAIFGLFMVWPKGFELLSLKLSGVINKASKAGKQPGNIGALLLGLTLGIVWTPCAGPILGAIITLIASQNDTARAGWLLIAYALGAGIPMLVIAYASQWASTRIKSIARHAIRLQQIFGVLVLGLAVAMYFQLDGKIQMELVQKFPAINLEEKLVQNRNPIISGGGKYAETPPAGAGIYNAVTGITEPSSTPIEATPKTPSDIQFHNYGPAPEFTGISHWLNSDPLTIAKLKGKVVLIDFWTYSCINCLRTLPYVTSWYDRYKDKGFVIVGVHTPEFEFEKVTGNVQTAISHLNIHYPVAQDNDYATWNAYGNQYWPAEYLIDKNGNVVYVHFGEGHYDITENAIRELLGLNEDSNAKTSMPSNKINSPEMYFGVYRLQYLTPGQTPSASPKDYSLPDSQALNTFALEGNWKFSEQSASLLKPGGKIRLKFSAGKVHMVAEGDKPITLKIIVDGKSQPDVTVAMSDLYTLFDSTDYREHTIDIQIMDSEFNAFTFTFG